MKFIVSDAIGYIVKRQLERRQQRLLEGEELEDEEDISRAIEGLAGGLDEDQEAVLAAQDLNHAGRLRTVEPEQEQVATQGPGG